MTTAELFRFPTSMATARIRSYRRAREVTQAQVAGVLGISRGTYNRFERWFVIPNTPGGLLSEDMVIAAINEAAK